MKFTIEERADRDSVRAVWYENGERYRKSFSSRSAAEMWVRDTKRAADIGASPAEIMAASRLIAGTGMSLADVVKAGLMHVRGSQGERAAAGMTFKEAAAMVVEAARKHGARERTIKTYEATHAVLCQHWGERACLYITSREVEEYLGTLRGRAGGHASAATRAHALRHMRMVLRCAGVGDPLREVHVSQPRKEVSFFTVEECRSILGATPSAARGFVAVAMFAGIRPENLERVAPECVSVVDRRIRIPASADKTGVSQVLDASVVPEALWRWLESYPYRPLAWAPLQKKLRRAVGRWVQDGLRHTAATYYCNLRGVSDAARLLTHTGEQLVKRHYAGVVERAQSARFYAIHPATVPPPPELREWPSDSALAAMLKARPALTVAKELGCSDAAITKRCRARGIPKPGRGHWMKIECGSA